VRWAAKKQNGKVPPTEKLPKDTPGTASIYVSFTCFNVMGDITEEVLRQVFEKYGEVSDVTIKYSTYDEVSMF
jgi:RNA recognition motif-containing protein